jgi:hypothetical protein
LQRPHQRNEGQPGKLRELKIGDHAVRRLCVVRRHPRDTVGRRHDTVPLGFQYQGPELAKVRVVVDEEDRTHADSNVQTWCR